VTTLQPTDSERIIDHLASMSWMAALPDDRRNAAIAQMRELIETGETPAELPVKVRLGLAGLA
jgi:hypothetical protein